MSLFNLSAQNIQFNGFIGNIPITFFINHKMNDWQTISYYSGFYYYNSQKLPIQIKGSFNSMAQGGADPSTLVYIEESYNGKVTGYFVSTDFKGPLDNVKTLQGIWQSADGSKKYNFKLTK